MTNKTSKTQQMRAISKKAQQQGVSRRASVKNDKIRFYLMWAVTAVCFAALLGKALWLQVINQNWYEKKAQSAIVSKRTIQPNRGVIYDRHNTPLALSTPMKTLSFNAREYAAALAKWQKRKLAITKNLPKLSPEEQEKERKDIIQKDARFDLAALATSVGVDEKKLQAVLAKKAKLKGVEPKDQPPLSQYLVLKRRLPPNTADVVLAKRFYGVHSETEYKRYYPQPQPNAQLLGYLGMETEKKMVKGKEIDVATGRYIGRAGLERVFDKTLTGTPGKMSVVLGAEGFGVVDDTLIEPEIAGENLVTSIDARLQYILYRELEKAGRLRQARSASGVVVDTRTGEVLAMSNWPSFNSNNLKERNNQNELNRVLVDVFEPGSVVKPLTVVAGLESGKFHKNSVIHTGGRIKIHSKVFTDHGLPADISLKTLIQRSSNLGSIKIGHTLPRDGVANMFQKLGLGKKTGLNFPAEAAGNVTAPLKRQKLKRANMTFGYAVEVTLAQLAQAYATLAGNGVRKPLTFQKQTSIPSGEQIISAETANAVLNMMESVTQKGGTGTQASISGYRVAGKTGTAKKLRTDGEKGYQDGKYRALFVGVAPVSSPRFVTAILVEDPVGDFTGGKVAAPVFKQVMQEALRLNNVPMDKAF